MAISQYPAASWESYRQKRNCLPEIATAPLGPRNDKSGAVAVFTMAGLDRQHCAGPGCPLPYILHICKNQGQAIGLPLCFVLLQLRVAHEDGRELCAGGIAGRLEAAVLAVDDARADAPAQRVNGP